MPLRLSLISTIRESFCEVRRIRKAAFAQLRGGVMTDRMEEIKRRWYGDRPDFMPSGTHEADMRDINYMVDRIAWLEAAVRELESGCKAACGYLLNAKIDLETGAPKRTAIATIEGGLKTVRAALSHPIVSELTREKGNV